MSNRTLAGLLVAIAASDLLTTRLEPPHADAALKILIIAGFLTWARRFAGLRWDELGLARADAGAGARLGALAALIIGAGIAVLVLLPATRGYFQTHQVASDSGSTRVLEPLLLIPFGTVVYEEVIFRGVLLGALLRSGSRTRSVVITSVAFGLWHIPPALTDARGHSAFGALGVLAGTIAITTLAGVLFAWLRLRSRSLVAPIFGHVATNSFAYVGAIVALHF